MNMQIKESIQQAVRRIVELLVAKDYAAVEALTVNPPVPMKDFAAHLDSFGWTFVMPPDEAFEPDTGSNPRQFAIYEVAGRGEWKVDFALWTAEHCRSDLTLKLNFSDVGSNRLEVQLYDAVVM